MIAVYGTDLEDQYKNKQTANPFQEFINFFLSLASTVACSSVSKN